jgi:superfamily II DNA or RNA helicase
LSTYYTTHYADLRFPIAAAPGQVGLRKAQLGALWALGSHFTVSSEPALVVMPTGSGKTAVITLIPFLLQAGRVLVITSNRPVRQQIASEFKAHKILTNLGVVAGVTMPGPKVREVVSRVPTTAAWELLRDFEVVVALPGSVSPILSGVATPPPDLFDLVLVDEAHHQPADTWNALLAAFPASRRAFFTATPTRRDRRPVQAKLIYAYSVAAAQADGFFGAMRFIPVQPTLGADHDVAVARAAAVQLNMDRASGLKHCLLVRTDSKAQAEILFEIYKRETPQLRLDVVHSGRSYRKVRQSIEKLEKEELDGIICVDMMSEGFDFPRLKIAAIHIPHRSLEVTLQFVGRFARTNDPSIGEAKFLAVPSDIADEVGRLYSESAEWDHLVANLSQARLEREQRVREVISGFQSIGPQPAPGAVATVPLYTLRPKFHVMVVQTQQVVDLASPVRLPPLFRIERQEVNAAAQSVVVIGNERERPKWTTSDVLSRSEYELFVIYFEPVSRLLFLCASRHSPEIYDHLATSYSRGAHRTLPTYQLNRVLNGLTEGQFFSVGMRSRIVGDRIESYRILAGSSAEKALTRSDARFFSRGHVMGRGKRNGQPEVIGYSSGSKIWSVRSDQIPVLLQWCRQLAGRMNDAGPISSQGDLDQLPVGEQASGVQSTITFVDWTEDVYRDPIPELVGPDGNSVRLGDIDLLPGARSPDGRTLEIQLDCAVPDPPRVRFDLQGWPHFTAVNQMAQKYQVRSGRESSALLAYLNAELLDFYGPDLSRVRGREVFQSDSRAFEAFDRDRIESLDWPSFNADIQCEFGTPPDGRRSVQDCVKDMLRGQDGVVVFDHRSGEVADFVHVRRGNQALVFTFYHCKGSQEPFAGSRVVDAYEVCGQIVRSIRWVGNERGLIARLLNRLTTGSILARGTSEELRAMRNDLARLTPEIHVCLVQPGLSRAKLDDGLLHVLAAADDYVRRGRATLHVLASN